MIPAYGAMAAVGALLAVLLAQRAADVVGVDRNAVWSLSIGALCAALVAQRLTLVVVNWNALRARPGLALALAMVHHPLLAAAGVAGAVAFAAAFARWRKLPWAATADALAAPVALGLAFEQVGAFLAGAGYGIESRSPWAVVYTSPQAALWSGTPLGVPLEPVQLVAAVGWLALALLVWFALGHRRAAAANGDATGLFLMGSGVVVFLSELMRDRVGRGEMFSGALDAPQAASVVLVLVGALRLRERGSEQ